MFTGIYFDGQTSRSRRGWIELPADGLHITYTDDETDKVTLIWDLSGIHAGHFTDSSKVTLKYGDHPMQYIEVSDPGFLDALKAAYPQKKFNATDFEFLRRNGAKGIVLITMVFLLLALGGYFFVLPPVAEFWAGHVPISTEISLGDKMYDNIITGYTIDQRLTKEANEYWRAMHIPSPYLVNITVVEESQPNAFALPGGQIIVFDGLIKRMKDPGELAGLLAHEYSHIQLRHSIRLLSRNLAGYIFISVLLNDASGTAAILATNANSLKELSFSRDMEHNADQAGYDLLQSAHISPAGMLSLFETLKDYNDVGISLPQFISTHPLTDSRISYIRDRLSKDKSSYGSHEDLQKIWNEIKAGD